MTLSQLEKNIYELPLDDQLRLMERLAQNIRNLMATKSDIEIQLAAMANDPEIQKELRMIEEEFALTEADGLELT
ncbi:MAG: hypothetical protein SVT56_07100 [Chloroflexota bacterium]|nr:hypothetical protein [Chloroflexota bacterium]